MNCTDLPIRAADYHAGTLDSPARARFEAHLQSCRDCRAADQEYREGLQALPPWPAETPDCSDDEAIEALFAAAARPSTPPAWPTLAAGPTPLLARSRRGPRATWLPLALAASLLVGLGGLGWWTRPALTPDRQDTERLLAEASEPDDAATDWADLGRLEESLLAEQANTSDAGPELEPQDVDPARLEEDLWSELARDEADLADPWPAGGPSLEDEIGRLDRQQQQRLMALFEQG